MDPLCESVCPWLTWKTITSTARNKKRIIVQSLHFPFYLASKTDWRLISFLPFSPHRSMDSRFTEGRVIVVIVVSPDHLFHPFLTFYASLLFLFTKCDCGHGEEASVEPFQLILNTETRRTSHTLFNNKRETDQSDECPGQMVVLWSYWWVAQG